MPAPPMPIPDDLPNVWARLLGNVSQVANHYGVHRQTITRWRDELDLPNLRLTGVSQTATGGVSQRFKAEVPFIAPPTLPGDWTKPKRPKINTKKPRSWALFSDPHCPFHSEPLLASACAWLDRTRPTDGVINGDLLDFPSVSTYAEKEDWVADVNACLRSACRWLKAIVDASPQTRWTYMPGNHENRLNRYLMDKAPALWGIRPGGDDEYRRWHDLRNLLLLDQFGIALHPEPYPDAEFALTPKFVVTHGDYTKRKSGNSAHAALDNSDHCFAQGHDHRIGQVFQTKWGTDKKMVVHMGMQLGTMADVDYRGLGYAKKPDWQMGFGVVHTWPDGLFSGELAVFVDDTLLIGGQRF